MGYVVSFSLTSDLIKQWEEIPRMERSALVQRLLREEFSGSTTKVKKRVNKLLTNSTAVEKLPTSNKVDKRNPEVQQVIDAWKEYVGPSDGTVEKDRRYAKLTINKHTVERTIGAIKAIIPSKQLQFSPSITSMQDLYNKFGKLEDAFRREKLNQDNDDRELTQDELNKEFGL